MQAIIIIVGFTLAIVVGLKVVDNIEKRNGVKSEWINHNLNDVFKI